MAATGAASIFSYIAAGLSIANSLGAFGGGKDGTTPAAAGAVAAIPAAPAITAPTVMPTVNDATVQDAKKKQVAALATRRGRQSTILSQDTAASTDLLGG